VVTAVEARCIGNSGSATPRLLLACSAAVVFPARGSPLLTIRWSGFADGAPWIWASHPQTFKVISISQPRTLFKCAPPFPSFPR
jgi:hypothetical protein